MNVVYVGVVALMMGHVTVMEMFWMNAAYVAVMIPVAVGQNFQLLLKK